jgi:hypothetical protein
MRNLQGALLAGTIALAAQPARANFFSNFCLPSLNFLARVQYFTDYPLLPRDFSPSLARNLEVSLSDRILHPASVAGDQLRGTMFFDLPSEDAERVKGLMRKVIDVAWEESKPLDPLKSRSPHAHLAEHAPRDLRVYKEGVDLAFAGYSGNYGSFLPSVVRELSPRLGGYKIDHIGATPVKMHLELRSSDANRLQLAVTKVDDSRVGSSFERRLTSEIFNSEPTFSPKIQMNLDPSTAPASLSKVLSSFAKREISGVEIFKSIKRQAVLDILRFSDDAVSRTIRKAALNHHLDYVRLEDPQDLLVLINATRGRAADKRKAEQAVRLFQQSFATQPARFQESKGAAERAADFEFVVNEKFRVRVYSPFLLDWSSESGNLRPELVLGTGRQPRVEIEPLNKEDLSPQSRGEIQHLANRIHASFSDKRP